MAHIDDNNKSKHIMIKVQSLSKYQCLRKRIAVLVKSTCVHAHASCVYFLISENGQGNKYNESVNSFKLLPLMTINQIVHQNRNLA